MSWLDFVVLAIVGYSIFAGFRSGFARVGIGLAATVLGILFGFWFYGVVGAHLADYVTTRALANLLGFLLVFVVFIVAGAIAGRIAAHMFRWVGLSWLDRLLGTAFGLLRGAVITVAVVTVVLAFAPTPPPRSIAESKTLPYVIGTSSVLTAITPHEVKDAFQQTKEKLKKIWSDRQLRKPNEV